jgi:hypothetical protein
MPDRLFCPVRTLPEEGKRVQPLLISSEFCGSGFSAVIHDEANLGGKSARGFLAGKEDPDIWAIRL